MDKDNKVSKCSVSDEEDEEFLDDDPGLDIVYKENLEVSPVISIISLN
jgi:hypothetical protein